MKVIRCLLCLFLCVNSSIRICAKNDYESEVRYFEEQVTVVSVDKIPSLSEQIQEKKKDFQHIQKQCKKYKKQKFYKKCQKWIDRLDVCQEKLENRFRQHYQSFYDNGTYNPNQIIQGLEQLPAYGSISSKTNSSYSSCLVDDVSIQSYSTQWLPFIENGTISAGTWTYPSGGMHLGLDVASSLLTPIYASANGIVLYADNPVDSNNGYLGNYCGWPLGGGNTIFMILAVNDELFGVSLNHLSNQLYVHAGQQITQGDLLALSGNSGNSTGPHTHIEIFKIHTTLEGAVSYFVQGADFSLGNGFEQPATCSAVACRIRPETVL